MIRLRAMRDDEFPAYLAYFIPDYAEEIVTSYGVSQTVALAQAQRSVEDSLPDGPATKGQRMFCIEDTAVLGFLWVTPDAAAGTVFISDFYVMPDQQNKGIGRAALAALEDWAKGAGLSDIRLRVAGDNARARHLYDSCGFAVTGVNMGKRLTPDRTPTED